MSTTNINTHTFSSFLYEGTKNDYTKRLINKIIVKLLDIYEEEFFTLCLDITKNGEREFKCDFFVEETQRSQLRKISLPCDTNEYINTICNILSAYNAYYADLFKWNKMKVTLHFEGEYKTDRVFDEHLEAAIYSNRNTGQSNIINLAKMRTTMPWSELNLA